MKARLTGGRQLTQTLREIGRKMTGSVRVGFLERSTYPSRVSKKGKATPALSVAQVMFWNEYGTTRSKPRPAMRQTVAENEGSWGGDLAKIAAATNYDGKQTLALMGTRIKDQIVSTIARWPADNVPSTVKRKGFNHGLVDKGIAQRAVDFEVSE